MKWQVGMRVELADEYWGIFLTRPEETGITGKIILVGGPHVYIELDKPPKRWDKKICSTSQPNKFLRLLRKRSLKVNLP